MAEPVIRKVIRKDMDLKKIAGLVQSRIEVFPDIPDMIDFFEAVPDYDNDMYNNKRNKCNPDKSLSILTDILPLLEEQEDFSNDALFTMLKAYGEEKGFKVGLVMWPIRTAVSGKRSTPGGATEIMDIIGKEETLQRIRAAIEKLEA